MSRVVSLNGEGWQVRAALGNEWRWHVGPSKAWDAPGSFPARVPGSVVDDLWRAGEVPDPYRGRNSLLVEWVPERAWVYRRLVDLGPQGSAGLAVLAFAGVDHRTSVFVDGVLVGEHEGAFTPFEVELGDALSRGGQHLLAVVLHPAPPSEPQMGDTDRVRVHKSRMSYGWDFCPRMIHLGIWRPVELHLGTAPWSACPKVSLGADLSTGVVEVPGATALRLYAAEGPIADGFDDPALLAGVPLFAQAQGGRIEVETPELWWPNGAGPATLFHLVAERDEQVRHFPIGFRHLELAPNPGAPVGARPYTAVLNGRRLYLKGWNWVPLDVLSGVPRPEKLAHLLTLAADAGVNLLRVWGGGLVETDEFYRLCDRLGLMVWQEFAQSSSGGSSVPSDDPEFVAMMVAQARELVPLRRHHPSLAWWGGGNELAEHAEGRDDVPLDESTPVLGALGAVVAELDPERPFLPTSPSGPRFLNRLDLIAEDPEGQHDVHGPWEHQGLSAHQALYDAGTSLWLSEAGVEGMTGPRALERVVPEDERWPADRTNPVYEHL
ncbi:MAG: beta-galactosidase/beta-glucuronidase, partial [Acidimicrobiaceae bacterium]|nr:beta-galactosidase/beta-glucuronidase [Acidimicrobiaceae bacterium]